MSGKYVRVHGMKIDDLDSNLNKKDLENLIEDIERLGDLIGNINTLGKSIASFFKENNDVHAWNVASIVVSKHLNRAEEEYTRFHTDFFEYMNSRS